MSNSNLSSPTFHHFTLDDRIQIQSGLDQDIRLVDLARQLGKHPSSVAKEIARNRSRRMPPHFNDKARNSCILSPF